MKTAIINEITVITAEDGMMLRRKSDGLVMGKQVYLGYTHYLNGEVLEKPMLEIPEHYEEIEEPIESEEYDIRNA